MKIENVVVISLEDYTEYQELKNKKKEIDFSRLKTGSVVKLKRSEHFCGINYEIDFNKNFDIVIVNENHGIAYDNEFIKNGTSMPYITFHQNKNFLLASCKKTIDYITEVISY